MRSTSCGPVGGGVDQQIETGLPRAVLNATDQGGKERTADLRQQQADGVGAATGQRAGGRVRGIVQGGDRAVD
jgi:hypothetical protein